MTNREISILNLAKELGMQATRTVPDGVGSVRDSGWRLTGTRGYAILVNYDWRDDASLKSEVTIQQDVAGHSALRELELHDTWADTVARDSNNEYRRIGVTISDPVRAANDIRRRLIPENIEELVQRMRNKIAERERGMAVASLCRASLSDAGYEVWHSPHDGKTVAKKPANAETGEFSCTLEFDKFGRFKECRLGMPDNFDLIDFVQALTNR